MPSVRDFRNVSGFSVDTINISGRYLGRMVYWKFYATENLYRIVLHSILPLQLPSPDWWSLAVDTNIKRRAERNKQDYVENPWHTTPGTHDVYYIGLRELNEIARANAEKIRDIVPEIDNFIARIEMILLPRNVVAHMNFLSETDRKRVDTAYEDFKNLTKMIQQSITLQIPQ